MSTVSQNVNISLSSEWNFVFFHKHKDWIIDDRKSDSAVEK